jgi:hypothetical protein
MRRIPSSTGPFVPDVPQEASQSRAKERPPETLPLAANTRREFLFAAFGTAVLAGCDQQGSRSAGSLTGPTATELGEPGTLTVEVSATQREALRAQSNGSVIVDWQHLEATAGAQLAGAGHLEGDIVVFEADLPSDAVTRTHGVDLQSSVGNFFFRLSAESGYVGGCIRKQGVPHLGLLLKNKKTGAQIVNLHLCSWKEGSQRCFGIYNSATQWCRRSCMPTRSQMRDDLKAALIAAGLTAAIALAIAAIVITVAAPALAL